jgi:hypothetical protein
MCNKSVCVTLLLLALGVGQAKEIVWDKAVYWDGRYATAWQGDGTATRDGLVAAGYVLKNADELKTWMQDRIQDKALSVVVFCMDSAPDTVTETMSSSCTLRKYLDSGGKIVWYGDIPFYYQSNSSATNTTWGDSGAPAVLGFNTSSATRNSNTTSIITPLGKVWGLTATWASQRPALPTITDKFDILATDAAGNACAWVKHYVANDIFRGFVRFRDVSGQALLADIIRVAEYVQLKAWNPSPESGAIGVADGYLTWSLGAFAKSQKVYFGTSPDFNGVTPVPGVKATSKAAIVTLDQPGTTYYWRVDEIDADGAVYEGDTWSFTSQPVNAFAPFPANGARAVDPNATLSWQPGLDAYLHELYFSTDKAAVENRDPAALRTDIDDWNYLFIPGTMPEQTTCYWAVDETNVDEIKTPGPLWSFTTIGPEDGAQGEYFIGMAPGGTPALTRVDRTIDFNWGDPGSPGDPIPVDLFSARWTADLRVDVEDTYTFITTSDDGARLWLNGPLIVDTWIDQSPTDHFSTGILLKPGVYSLEMEYYENGGGAVARLSWLSTTMARQIIPASALSLPRHAKLIYPLGGDVNVPPDVLLQWAAGGKAAQHDVYLGTDANAVAKATPASADVYQGRQAKDNLTFDPGELAWNTTYYWRVDEINDVASGSPWKGMVMSFTTADYLVVDDFESYSGDLNNEIYSFWLDNYDATATVQKGALVGLNDAPFVETRAAYVHGGRQSMPLHYDNSGPKYLFSQTERTLDKVQDWTTNDVKDLSLWVVGHPVAAVETAPGQYRLSANSGDIWGTSDNFSFYYKTLTGDGSIEAKVVSISSNGYAWSKPGVMIRDTLDPASTYAFMFPTPDGRRAFQNRPAAGGNGFSAHSATGLVKPPFWVRVVRKGNDLTAYYSTDGTNWVIQPDTENTGGDASTNPVTIPMGASVCIGLALCANDLNRLSVTADFSDVKTTGTVTGNWTAVSLGNNSVNTPEKFYVIVEDTTGKKTAPQYEPTLVNAAAWTQWKIPLSSLTGISLSKVKKVYIGVGDPKNPVAGGTGMLYIDDICVIK